MTRMRSIFSMRGDVCRSGVPQLRRDLDDFANDSSGDVVVDCHELASIDDAAVAALLSFHNDMLAIARRVSVRRVPAACRGAFEARHLSGLFGDVRRRPRLV